MKALVTGITGFIGSHTAEHLVAAGHDVMGIGQTVEPNSAMPISLRRVPLLSWDIRKPAPPAIVERVRKFAPAVIFHFAAVSLPGQCGRDEPTQLARAVNVEGAQHVFRLAEDCRAKRFLFASSSHVYGPMTAAKHRVSETSPCQPAQAYGQTKVEAEKGLRNRQDTTDVELCITRGFQHIGPRQPSGLMLTDWLDQLPHQPSTLHVRNTYSFLDLVDVRDAARAYLLLGSTETCIDVCNVGSGHVVRSGDVLDTLLAQLKWRPQIEAASVEPQWNPIADTARLCDLGWAPQIDYPETIEDMLRQRCA